MTMIVRLSKVPKNLWKSELYLSFNRDVDDVICVPKDCLKSDSTVKTVQDAEHLFRTIRFWVLNIFPDALISFLLAKFSCHAHVLGKFELEFPTLQDMLKDLNTAPKHKACPIAARYGRVDFLNYFVWRKYPCDARTLRVAAQHGNFDSLRYMHMLLAKYSLRDINCTTFVERGNIAAVKYLVQHGAQLNPDMCAKAVQCGQLRMLMHLQLQSPADIAYIGVVAAMHDQVQCLQYAMERGCTLNKQICNLAIGATSAKCLEHLISTHPQHLLTEHVFTCACKQGKLTQLKVLYKHNCPMHKLSFAAAAVGGSLECLEFLSEIGFDCWRPYTVAVAAQYGHASLLKALLERGCEWDRRATQQALDAPTGECLKILLRHACAPDCRSLGLGYPQYCKKCLMLDEYKNRGEENWMVLGLQKLTRNSAKMAWDIEELQRSFRKLNRI